MNLHRTLEDLLASGRLEEFLQMLPRCRWEGCKEAMEIAYGWLNPSGEGLIAEVPDWALKQIRATGRQIERIAAFEEKRRKPEDESEARGEITLEEGGMCSLRELTEEEQAEIIERFADSFPAGMVMAQEGGPEPGDTCPECPPDAHLDECTICYGTGLVCVPDEEKTE